MGPGRIVEKTMAGKPMVHRDGGPETPKGHKGPDRGRTKSNWYRVYLAWEATIDDPMKGMGCLIRPRHRKKLSVDLTDDEGLVMTVTSSSMEFMLVDDSGFGEADIPPDSDEIFLKLVRRRLFGREILHAEPVGTAPKGCVLSGRTGRVVWGGADTVRDISPRPIPLRYWIKSGSENKPQKKVRKDRVK